MNAVRNDNKSGDARTGRALAAMVTAALVLLVFVGTQSACRPQADGAATQPPAIATASDLMRKAIVQDFAGFYECHGKSVYGELTVMSDLEYLWQEQEGFACWGEEGQVLVRPDSVLLVPEVRWTTCDEKPHLIDLCAILLYTLRLSAPRFL